MNNLIFPPYLKSGDKIAIISPSGKIDKSFLKGAKERLGSWGYKPVIGKHADASSGTFAGTIKQRASDLQWAMDQEDIRAIFCSRGGYGIVHLLDKLDFTRFIEHPKWLMGYSDVTALHNLFQSKGYASIHSLMARHLTVEPENDESSIFLRELLSGQLPEYSFPTHKLNRKGMAKGVLRGGNLSVMYGLRGTPLDIPAEGTILYMEDINERPHAVERMIYNLKLGGILERLSGIIIGQFTEYDEDRSLGKVLYAAIADIVKEYDYPVCFDFPVGHVTRNYPLINGSEVTLEVGSKHSTLSFKPV